MLLLVNKLTHGHKVVAGQRCHANRVRVVIARVLATAAVTVRVVVVVHVTDAVVCQVVVEVDGLLIGLGQLLSANGVSSREDGIVRMLILEHYFVHQIGLFAQLVGLVLFKVLRRVGQPAGA